MNNASAEITTSPAAIRQMPRIPYVMTSRLLANCAQAKIAPVAANKNEVRQQLFEMKRSQLRAH